MAGVAGFGIGVGTRVGEGCVGAFSQLGAGGRAIPAAVFAGRVEVVGDAAVRKAGCTMLMSISVGAATGATAAVGRVDV